MEIMKIRDLKLAILQSKLKIKKVEEAKTFFFPKNKLKFRVKNSLNKLTINHK